jgi:D-arabinose 1-dehydrogenase-like Zn-dependent alcohol dehydrogenase
VWFAILVLTLPYVTLAVPLTLRVVLTQSSQIEVQDIPVPEIGPEEVLIKLNVTGLCMSDVHFMMEDWGLPPM